MKFRIAFTICIAVLAVATSHFSRIAKAIKSPMIDGRLFDKYGSMTFEKEKERLDNLAAQLKQEPQSKGYIILYQGKKRFGGNLKARALRAMKYLIHDRGVDPRHIVAAVITGGHRAEFSVELWIWPFESPDDLPRFQPGVSEREVSLIKGIQVAKGRERN